MRALQEPLVRLHDKPGTQNNESGKKGSLFLRKGIDYWTLTPHGDLKKKKILIISKDNYMSYDLN